MQSEDGKDRRASEKVLWYPPRIGLLLMHTVEKGEPIPRWLDHEFLYSINYGPIRPEDLMKTRSLHGWVFRGAPLNLGDHYFDETKRTELTVMDRSLAAKLQETLYDSQDSPGFLTDWPPSVEIQPRKGQLSPFDYDPTSAQTFALICAENFVHNCVWDPEYSSRILASRVMPSMSDVVMDMSNLIHSFTANV